MPRMTKQKRLLHEELEKLDSFFDVLELHKRIAKKKKCGLTTIYRFLNGLEAKEQIHSFICNDRKIYSRSTNNHIHFRCNSCSSVEHVITKKTDFLDAVAGSEVCHFQIDIVGICSNCRAKKKEQA